MGLARAVLTTVLVFFASALHAEDDGGELLALMSRPASREVAQLYVEEVSNRWDRVLFCIPEGDRQQQALDAVRAYLEENPDELYRPRRYLIVQGLRGAFPCTALQ